MVPKSRILKVGVVAMASISALLWGGSIAHASPSNLDLPDEQVVSADAPTTFDDQPYFSDKSMSATEADHRVLDYWTVERMNNAIPADIIAEDVSTTKEASPKVEKIAPQRLLSDPVSGADMLGRDRSARNITNFSNVNGKVFFTNASDGRNYVCSGSALNSSSKRLVITAGHCVHGGKGGAWHKNWVFVPSYFDGQRPFGTFQAKTFRAFNGWISNGEGVQGFERDVAFVTTYTNESGRKAVDAVGGYGLRTGGSRNFDVTVFGCPANLNNGQRMRACWGRTTTHHWWLSQFPKISGCNFGGGSSGGPWLDDYSNATGLGHVRSVTSFGPHDNAYSAGPYFDDAVMTMFNDTRND